MHHVCDHNIKVKVAIVRAAKVVVAMSSDGDYGDAGGAPASKLEAKRPNAAQATDATMIWAHRVF